MWDNRTKQETATKFVSCVVAGNTGKVLECRMQKAITVDFCLSNYLSIYLRI